MVVVTTHCMVEVMAHCMAVIIVHPSLPESLPQLNLFIHLFIYVFTSFFTYLFYPLCSLATFIFQNYICIYHVCSSVEIDAYTQLQKKKKKSQMN